MLETHGARRCCSRRWLAAADAVEAGPVGHGRRTAVMTGNVVPVREVIADPGRANRVVVVRFSASRLTARRPQPNVSSGRLRSNTASCAGFCASSEMRNKGRGRRRK